jgi:uncharacterized protein (DUF488 family)
MELQIYTIGHSNNTFEHLVELLRQNGVERLVDVRSVPSSKYSPQFNRAEFSFKIESEGIEYFWLGDKLGGFRKELQNELGMRCDDKFDEDEKYREGIAELLKLARKRTTAVMCSEEDPRKCHRHEIIAQTLLRRSIPECAEFEKIEVLHIRSDGKIESAGDIEVAFQPSLF